MTRDVQRERLSQLELLWSRRAGNENESLKGEQRGRATEAKGGTNRPTFQVDGSAQKAYLRAPPALEENIQNTTADNPSPNCTLKP